MIEKQITNPENPHYFLADEVLVPNLDKCDGGRTNMFTNHLTQHLVLENAELPRVFTNFENQVGQYSSGYYTAQHDLYVIAVYDFSPGHKKFLVAYTEDGDEETTIEVITYVTARNLTESYGFKQKLCIDVVPEMTIPKGTLLFHNGEYDENLNLKIGVNLKAVFLPKLGKTYEDAIIISESAAHKKLTHSDVTEIFITLNNNDILLNLYGTLDRYQPYPNPGEKIKGSVLCARRRLDYSTVFIDFKNSSVTNVSPDDSVFFAHGVVEDVTVYSNAGRHDGAVRVHEKYTDPFDEIAAHQHALYTQINDTLQYFRDGGDGQKYKFTDNTNYLLQTARDYLNVELKFSLDRTVFEGRVIKITVREEVGLQIGSKITGRYGSKGVISGILPDDEMPVTEDGTERAEVCLNPLGVFGRMNIAQNYEQELNFTANQLIKRHAGMQTWEEYAAFETDILRFYELVNPTQHEAIVEFRDLLWENTNTTEALASESMEPWAVWLRELLDGQMHIHQPPFFGNITPDAQSKIFNEFGIEKLKFAGVLQPLVIGEIYFLKLKHEAAGKFSTRSSGPVSLLSVPFKNAEGYKRGTLQHNNNPVRFGEQELFNMYLLKSPKEVINFLETYSSNEDKRRAMLSEMINNGSFRRIEAFFEGKETSEFAPSNAAETIRAVFRSIGIELVHVNSEGIVVHPPQKQDD